ncbi:MAG: IS3 family transposase [Nitrospinaceae bacterium]|nr:IS3 family transposase [Nitrospinaceae bacterium]
MAHDTRDKIVDFVNYWSSRAEVPAKKLINWTGISISKFYDWKRRYGMINEHNSWIPRDFWLELWEKQAIVAYCQAHPLDGYRRLTFMMLDEDIVAVSPSSVYRVLKNAGLLRKWNGKNSRKGQGFKQPGKPHSHWHVDVCYINICATFYYLCAVLDGYSRYIVHWEIRESMKEADVEIIIQRAREKFPGVHPRIISDNGPQFIARDFKEFVRISGMSHVRTSPSYPQSNGKLERWHATLKSECIRPKTPLSLQEARGFVTDFVKTYNYDRLHSAIGYVAPVDRLTGRDAVIFAQRDRKLSEAREQRRINSGASAKERVLAS